MKEQIFCRKELLGQGCLGCPAIDMVKQRAATRKNGATIEDIAGKVESQVCPPGLRLDVVVETRMSSLRWIRR